ncbi:MAG: helix-hairpin-helix domain-containing protein [Peptococcaceae bacterium]|nr:helix-hairpin-helix domain-containing protein [Peptococcaceae bacterium]
MDRKLKYLWWGVLGALVLAAGIKFLLPVKSPVTIEEAQGDREIVVYVTGAVNYSGLIHLPLDSRLEDALKKAGLRTDADIEALNPAQKLKDGQKIIVPSKLPAENGQTGSTGSASPSSASLSSAGVNSSRVNINTAGAGELDSIPGIGPAIAQRIIDYRMKNGLFSSPEEIQNVSGIGPKTYEKMAPYITVGH